MHLQQQNLFSEPLFYTETYKTRLKTRYRSPTPSSSSSPNTADMLSSTILTTLALALGATAARHPGRAPAYTDLSAGALHRRSFTGQTIAFSCYGGGGDCECPLDTTGEQGVLINVFPGFQCAYPSGACTWDDAVRTLHLPETATADADGYPMPDGRAQKPLARQLPDC